MADVLSINVNPRAAGVTECAANWVASACNKAAHLEAGSCLADALTGGVYQGWVVIPLPQCASITSHLNVRYWRNGHSAR